MNANLILIPDQLDEAISSLKCQLAELEERLTAKELELATLEAVIKAFQFQYLAKLGSRYAKIDELEANIAELLSKRNPYHSYLQQAAQTARQKANQTAETLKDLPNEIPAAAFIPTEDIKKLYRIAAKRMHPDLADDEIERKKRNQYMSRLTVAFQSGDLEELKAILDQWESEKDASTQNDKQNLLTALQNRIQSVRYRIATVTQRIIEIQALELFVLKCDMEEAQVSGIDWFSHMMKSLDDHILELESHLRILQGNHGRQ